jgi:hypothetical protein
MEDIDEEIVASGRRRKRGVDSSSRPSQILV